MSAGNKHLSYFLLHFIGSKVSFLVRDRMLTGISHTGISLNLDICAKYASYLPLSFIPERKGGYQEKNVSITIFMVEVCEKGDKKRRRRRRRKGK